MPERRPRILRVITWLPVGGIERRLVATLPRLRERFEVELVCIRERGPLADELEAAGVPVTLIPFASRWDPRALRALAHHMTERRIDLVHSHMYRSNIPATVAARMAGVRAVWAQVHNVGTWETRRQAWMDRALCRWRTGVIAVSERVRDDVRATLGLEADRVRVIHNGVDLVRFRAARALRDQLRAEAGLAPEDLVLLFAARLVPQKCADDLLAAVARLQQQNIAPALRVWIAGDGPERERLESLARDLPNPSDVQFLGRRHDIPALMAASDLFVLPSTREGFSNALVEAMASGLAIVASDVGGNAEAIRHGTDGLIIPPRNVDELTGSLARLLQEPPFRAALAASAAVRADLFSLDRMVAALARLYDETLAASPLQSLPRA